MKLIQKLQSFTKYEWILILSILLILLKGFEYLIAGILYPLSIGILLLSPFIFGLSKPIFNFQKIIKYWSILVVSYGITRILLHSIIYIDSSGVPSAAYYQFTIWYGIKTTCFLFLGLYLYKNRNQFLCFSEKNEH